MWLLLFADANTVRAEGDYSNDKINGKIQQAEQAKVHTMLCGRPARHGRQRRQRPRPRQRQPGRQAEGGSGGGYPGRDPRAAGVALVANLVRQHHNWAWANSISRRGVTVLKASELRFQATVTS